MRVLLASEHRYPSEPVRGSGRNPKPFPSGSANHLFDLLAKGLAELGHEVIYCLPQGWSRQMPAPVRMVREPDFNVDIAHLLAYRDAGIGRLVEARGIPVVHICHRDPVALGMDRADARANWIAVSRSLAETLGIRRYVHNGLDPGDYHFSEDKQDYLLFMSALEWAEQKGLDTALSLARRAGLRLVVAGTGLDRNIIQRIARRCRDQGAEFVGDVRGPEKARLFASARALLHPTAIPEAFGLCMVEALMSGTPVIASPFGAAPEIVTPEVGFLCTTPDDYLAAIAGCGAVSARACRDRAVRQFHYRRMAEGYVREYRAEIARARPEPAPQ